MFLMLVLLASAGADRQGRVSASAGESCASAVYDGDGVGVGGATSALGSNGARAFAVVEMLGLRSSLRVCELVWADSQSRGHARYGGRGGG